VQLKHGMRAIVMSEQNQEAKTEEPRCTGSALNVLLSCPVCGGKVKDQIYIDGGEEHGNFYCLSVGCFMPPITFRGRVEYKTISKSLSAEIWKDGEQQPEGGYHCLLLLGHPEDDINICRVATGFYTKGGWVVFTHPINLRPCEMRAWGNDITVRAWKRFDR